MGERYSAPINYTVCKTYEEQLMLHGGETGKFSKQQLLVVFLVMRYFLKLRQCRRLVVSLNMVQKIGNLMYRMSHTCIFLYGLHLICVM